MSWVIRKYIDADGLRADIQGDKDSILFTLYIFRPNEYQIFRRSYRTIKAARQAMNNYGRDWKRIPIEWPDT